MPINRSSPSFPEGRIWHQDDRIGPVSHSYARCWPQGRDSWRLPRKYSSQVCTNLLLILDRRLASISVFGRGTLHRYAFQHFSCTHKKSRLSVPLSSAFITFKAGFDSPLDLHKESLGLIVLAQRRSPRYVRRYRDRHYHHLLASSNLSWYHFLFS